MGFIGFRKWTASSGILALVVAGAAAVLMADSQPSRTDWPMFGQNLSNTGSSAAENGISVKNAGTLKMKWAFTTGGDVSARAAIVNGVAYFPDWGGNLWAVNASNGKLVWSHQLSDYGLPAGSQSRTTPTVVDGTVYIGTQSGAAVLAISAASGALLWKTHLEPADPFAIVTSSPAVYGGVVIAGVASVAEGGTAYGIDISSAPARGSVVALNAADGSIAWKTYTTPSGYTGVGVWGSNAVVDPARGLVFVSTGNNYTHPTDSAYTDCINAGGTQEACSSPDNHVDSVLALSLTTGQIHWATKLVRWNQYGVTDGGDDWNVDCFFNGPQCPNPADGPIGPDYDFSSAPNLITYQVGNTTKQILGAGQKSGIYYALDPDTGAVLWQTQVGPGSSLGGMEWGSATDGKRIYVSIANFYGIPSAAGSAGSWAALDPETGSILWRKADPNGAIDIGPVTAANGVVYVSSMAGDASAPTMLALDGATGQTLWQFAAGSSVNAGATVANGVVYWGSGYAHLGIPGFTANNKFYAFTVR